MRDRPNTCPTIRNKFRYLSLPRISRADDDLDARGLVDNAHAEFVLIRDIAPSFAVHLLYS